MLVFIPLFVRLIYTEAWVIPSSHTLRRSASRTSTSSVHYQTKQSNLIQGDNSSSPIDAPWQSNIFPSSPSDSSNPATQYRPKSQLDLRILLIDNHDSYTYNLYQYLSTMTIHPIKVIMNDVFASWEDFLQNESTDDPLNPYDCIILSPGPGQPSHSADMGIVLETIRANSNVPILGVCLGHQALGYVYGSEVKLAPCGPVHGLMSSVQNLTCQLFDGLRQYFDVVRYHSLVVEFPSDEDKLDALDIEPMAWYNSTICMALRHKQYPHYGVQFHPESIGTGEAGYRLLWNFCEFADQYRQQQLDEVTTPSIRRRVAKTSTLSTPEQVFEILYSSRPNSFWLDSSTGNNSRFSIMGSDDGPLSRKIEYFGREHRPDRRGLHVTSGSVRETFDSDILTYLRQQLDESLPFDFRGGYVGYLGYEVRHDTQCWIFEQEGGMGCDASYDGKPSDDKTNPNVPTATFLFTDRSLLYDHHTEDWYVIGVSRNGNGDADTTSLDETISWMHDVQRTIKTMTSQHTSSSTVDNDNKHMIPSNGNTDHVNFVPNRSKAQYQMDISRSHEEIRNGESYELCVTNHLETELRIPRILSKEVHESPFELYKLLRQRNPAPFSAFMNIYPHNDSPPSMSSATVSICCSSPERFLSVKKAQPAGTTSSHQPRDFIVESKPIKGTAARYLGTGEDAQLLDSEIASRLKESVKDKAENLMIVDLLRNDLGRVCRVGSVHVPKLMHIESYATVHQMVSTVRGTLDGHTTNAIDVIEACFPGGSMTGAPKHRTMEIINEIEQGVSRGPYSGCLGYISLNGCMDMNIVIRSAVLTPLSANDEHSETWKASIGCGGAITALSDSDDEYEEMLLKSRVVRESILEWTSDKSSVQKY
ncbi:para-aminobenzoate synthase and glutamine amidotransferase, a bifunctional enzyme-like protein [Thalassiosira pseudonana CCMP1335]